VKAEEGNLNPALQKAPEMWCRRIPKSEPKVLERAAKESDSLVG